MSTVFIAINKLTEGVCSGSALTVKYILLPKVRSQSTMAFSETKTFYYTPASSYRAVPLSDSIVNLPPN